MSEVSERTTSRRRGWGPFTGMQLTVIICTVAVLVLFPVGAWAVTGSNVFITDPVGGGRARIDGHSGLLVTAHDPVTGKGASVNGAGQLSVSGAPARQYNNLSFKGGDAVVSQANPTADLFSTTTADHFSITSLTFTNQDNSTAQVWLVHYINAGSGGNCANPVGFNIGERMRFNMAANQTVHVDFPTPLTWSGFQHVGHLDCFDVQLLSNGIEGVDVMANGFINS